jgi:hypothetical protein
MRTILLGRVGGRGKAVSRTGVAGRSAFTIFSEDFASLDEAEQVRYEEITFDPPRAERAAGEPPIWFRKW